MSVTTSYELGSIQNFYSSLYSSAVALTLSDGRIAVAGTYEDHTHLSIFAVNGSEIDIHAVEGTGAALAELASGDIVVAASDGTEVYFSVLTPDGDIVDNLENVEAGVGPGVSNLSLVALQNGNFAAVYQVDDGGDLDTFLDIRSPLGAPITVIPLGPSGDDERNPAIAVLNNGNIAVTWETDDGVNTSIDFAVYPPGGGSPVTGGSVVASSDVNSHPAITALTDGGFAIAYQTDAGADLDVHVQLYDENGIGGVGMGYNFPDDQSAPTLSVLSNGDIFLGVTNDDGTDLGPLWMVLDPTNLGVNVQSDDDNDSFSNEYDVTSSGTADGLVAAFYTDDDDGAVEGALLAPTRVSESDSDSDNIVGDEMRDEVTGNGGNDTIDGGDSDYDIAVYNGEWSDYTITEVGGTYTIKDNVGGRDGTDTVSNIEWLRFDGDNVRIADALSAAPVAGDDDNSPTGMDDPVTEDSSDSESYGYVFYNDTDANEDAGDYLTVNGVRTGTEAAGGTFSATGGTGIKGIYGTLVLEDYGDYTYTLDNADPDTQALKAGQTAADVFTYRIVDTQGLTDTAEITINVSGANDVPVITSNGGGATAAVSVAENSTLVTTIAAIDPDSTVMFALTGNDSSKFKLVGNQLHFVAAPDFEVRGDANADNVYDVTVFAADGTTLDTQALSVTVTNVNEAPVISSNGGGATAAVTVTENTALVTTLAAADPDGTAVTYSLTGADAAKFKLVGAQVQFVTPVDFDTRTDANGDGTYEVTVVASDGVLTDTQAISVGVTNIAGNTVNGTKKADKIDGTHKVKGLGATGEEDYINGKKGNDVIKGLDGNDTLVGGDGKDTITGGGGVDFFAFSAKLTAANADTIKDFVHDVDLIHLADSVFKTLGTALEAREFYAKKGAVEAHDKNDRIIYDKKTGNLYYDDDGNKVGGHDAVLFATLSTKPLIDAGDFAVV